MKTMDDPFEYSKPDWLIEIERKKRREQREKRLGRPVGTWGGKREGAGKRKPKDHTHEARINLTSIQYQILLEMGNGDWENGLNKLINEHI